MRLLCESVRIVALSLACDLCSDCALVVCDARQSCSCVSSLLRQWNLKGLWNTSLKRSQCCQRGGLVAVFPGQTARVHDIVWCNFPQERSTPHGFCLGTFLDACPTWFGTWCPPSSSTPREGTTLMFLGATCQAMPELAWRFLSNIFSNYAHLCLLISRPLSWATGLLVNQTDQSSRAAILSSALLTPLPKPHQASHPGRVMAVAKADSQKNPVGCKIVIADRAFGGNRTGVDIWLLAGADGLLSVASQEMVKRLAESFEANLLDSSSAVGLDVVLKSAGGHEIKNTTSSQRVWPPGVKKAAIIVPNCRLSFFAVTRALKLPTNNLLSPQVHEGCCSCLLLSVFLLGVWGLTVTLQIRTCVAVVVPCAV